MTPFPFSESCRLPSENKKRENFKNDLLKFPPVLPDDFCFICGKRGSKITTSSIQPEIRPISAKNERKKNKKPEQNTLPRLRTIYRPITSPLAPGGIPGG